MNRTFKNASVIILLILIMFLAFTLTMNKTNQVEELTQNEVVNYIKKDEVKAITLKATSSDANIYNVEGELKGKKGEEVTHFKTTTTSDGKLIKALDETNFDYKVEPAPQRSIWVTLLTTLLPMLLIFGFLMFFLQQSQGGGGKVMQFGKSKAKLQSEDQQKITFKDVAGVDEVEEELAEVVDFLKQPRKYSKLGAKIPKGVLLYGPPGTGKTLLAKAVAGEAGVPFFTISGSDFVEMFVGVGASRVRDLFEQAKKQHPCIIFIDEIDAVGRQRGAGLGGGHDEREQTLNQLLVEMDGFDANEGIIVIAATNRPDILDPALLRPGRFDRQIVVNAPDIKGRKEILQVHIKGVPLTEDVDLEVLARRTPGFTGADLANMVNEAALLAARYGKNKVSMEELEAAVERVIAGPEKKSRVINDDEKRLVSYHEAGHAVVSYFVPNSDPLHKISIIPRGGAGGYTLLLPEEDRNYATKSKMLDEVTIFMGGRVAEALVLKEISTGAQNDLDRATNIVRSMITRYGMSKNLGPITFGKHDQDQVFLGRDFSQDRSYSEEVAAMIDKEAHRMLDQAYNKAEEILSENMDKLEEVAQVLMDQETIEADEFYAIMKGEEYIKEDKTQTDQDAETTTDSEESSTIDITIDGNIKEEVDIVDEHNLNKDTDKDNSENPETDDAAKILGDYNDILRGKITNSSDDNKPEKTNNIDNNKNNKENKDILLPDISDESEREDDSQNKEK